MLREDRDLGDCVGPSAMWRRRPSEGGEAAEPTAPRPTPRPERATLSGLKRPGMRVPDGSLERGLSPHVFWPFPISEDESKVKQCKPLA